MREGDYSKHISKVIEVWKGRYKNEVVALKVFKVSPQDPHISKLKRVSMPPNPWQRVALCCSDIWQWLYMETALAIVSKHENTVPLYGVSTTVAAFCLVYPWYKNGNIMDYTEKNPGVNRYDLASTLQQTTHS